MLLTEIETLEDKRQYQKELAQAVTKGDITLDEMADKIEKLNQKCNHLKESSYPSQIEKSSSPNLNINQIKKEIIQELKEEFNSLLPKSKDSNQSNANNPVTTKAKQIKHKNDFQINKEGSDNQIRNSTSDLNSFENPVLCPRIIYQQHLYEFKSFSMYTALFILLKYCNANGQVNRLSTKKMANYYNYKSDRRIRDGLKRLEKENIISIDRTNKPYSYQIKNYDFTEKGGFVIPEELMLNAINKEFTLKDLRLQFYYMYLNHHSPNNQNKLPIKLETLKKIVNADSYEEIIHRANKLKNKFFTKIEIINNSIQKGLNKLKVKFKNSALGLTKITQNKIKKLKNHHHYQDIKYIFNHLDISFSWKRIEKAFEAIENMPKSALIAIKQNCTADRFQSSQDSINYFIKLLKLAKNDVIKCKY